MSQFEYERFHAGVHGPGRGDSLDTCVRRTLHMFKLLKEIDPTFAQWFEQGWTLEEALKRRLDLDRGELVKAFDKHAVKDAIWYSLSAWNGLDDDNASAFHVSWGNTRPEDIDSLTVDPHETGPTGERLIQSLTMARLLRALAITWEPQMGVVISSRHIDTAFADAAFEHRIGWINYFSHKLGPIPPLPSPVRTEPVEDKGSLVILTSERFSTRNPDHIALSLQVSAELKNAGILRPLTTATGSSRRGS